MTPEREVGDRKPSCRSVSRNQGERFALYIVLNCDKKYNILWKWVFKDRLPFRSVSSQIPLDDLPERDFQPRTLLDHERPIELPGGGP